MQLIKTSSFILILILAQACEDDSPERITREDLIGHWENLTDIEDRLFFDEWYGTFFRGKTPSDRGSNPAIYWYELSYNTMELSVVQGDHTNYTVSYYTCEVRFRDSDHQVLIIEGLEKVPPFGEGEEFRRVEEEN